jgi:hypothetical protein
MLYIILGVGSIKQTTIISGFDIVIEVTSKNIYSILLFFNKHILCTKNKNRLNIFYTKLINDYKLKYLIKLFILNIIIFLFCD